MLRELHSLIGLQMVGHLATYNGPLFTLMSRTRAAFKLALRYCMEHEDTLCADAVAKNLLDKDFRAFWCNINKR